MTNIINQNILNDIGLGALTDTQKEEVMASIGELIFQAVLIRVMEVLNEEDKVNLEKLFIEKAAPEEVFNFLREKVSNLEKITQEEVEKFKTKSVEIMAGAKGNN